jgi:hypothetical protein
MVERDDAGPVWWAFVSVSRDANLGLSTTMPLPVSAINSALLGVLE